MLRRLITRRGVFVSVLTVFLASCLRDDDEPPRRATATPLPEETAIPVPSPSPTPAATPEPTASATPLPSPTPTESPPAYRSPLTGQVLDRPARKPLAVQIDNASPAQPQSGLVDAEIVYETPTEAGVTRFTAFYGSIHPAEIGPVRSVRMMALNVIPAHDGILVYSGGSIDMIEALFQSGIAALHAEGNAHQASWRDPARQAPHNLYVSGPELMEVAQELDFAGISQAQSLTFGIAPSGGASVPGVEISFAAEAVSWRYDPERAQYQRFVNGQPHLDRTQPDQRITADNLIVIAVTFVWMDIADDPAAQQTLGVILTGEGDALLLREGQRYAARWSRADQSSPLRLIDNVSDEELALKTGRTWVSILPDNLDAVKSLPAN